MEIREINFEELQSVRKKCITFAKDGNKIVKPYKTLYSLEQITHDQSHKNLYIEVIKGQYRNDYLLFDDLEIICIPADRIPDLLTIEEISDRLSKYNYFGTDGFFRRLEMLEANHQHISMLHIEICKMLGKSDLAEHYAEYRTKRIEQQNARIEQARLEREAQKKEEEKRKVEEIENKIHDVLESFQKHTKVQNFDVDGKSVILYLMKKYGINIPLRTQGWINKALVYVDWNYNGKITYGYYKSSRDSKVFWEYLQELERKISENFQK